MPWWPRRSRWGGTRRPWVLPTLLAWPIVLAIGVSPGASAGARPAAVDCASSLSVSLPQPSIGRPVLDWILLPPASEVRGVTRRGPAPFRYFAKLPLWIRSDLGGTVEVWSADAAALTLGSVRTPETAVAVPRCPRSGQWVLYGGGIHVARPGCVRVRVRVGATSATARLAVGAPCLR